MYLSLLVTFYIPTSYIFFVIDTIQPPLQQSKTYGFLYTYAILIFYHEICYNKSVDFSRLLTIDESLINHNQEATNDS